MSHLEFLQILSKFQGVNDAPALSAAQVGIAVHGATDAAKNAADLILTEPGLSPIYGAVLESRRIFARIKAYVIYRVAASLVMVFTLSIVAFVSGCTVDALLVIILALLNDISMIPVAYDNAKATTKPQLPDARKLVLQALFYGFSQSMAGLGFIFIMDHSGAADGAVTLEDDCSSETRGFIWFHLVLVTELMVFSVRAPSFFLFSAPSIYLIASVTLTCIGSAFIAVYADDVAWRDIAWIVLFNVGSLTVTDVLKIWFRKIIDDEAGETIDSDELLQPPEKPPTETEKHMAKRMRYAVHNDSMLPPSDRHHIVQIQRRAAYDLFFSNDLSDALLYRHALTSMLARTSFPPSGRRESRRKTFSSPV